MILASKEGRNLNNDNFVNGTVSDANAVINFKLREKSIPVKHQIFNISGDRLIAKTIARLRTGHHEGMKFGRDNRRIFRNYDNCLDIELTPAYIFGCPAILAALQEIGVIFSSTNLYVDNIEQTFRTVICTHKCYTRAFGDGPRNFEPWSSDVEDTRGGTPSPSYHTTPTGGRFGSRQI
ncbi:uncharacterized protein TNCV_3776411 [Trichonephila clavipes]|nr:uncharacterized protein TNCV_3776411 [Trichonephila clavipes]